MISSIADFQSHSALTDAQVVAKVIAGDTPLFELIMRRHNQRLYRIARAIIPNNDEAEDIVQDAYVRAYTNLSKFEGRSSVATWLSRITLHEALRRRRKRRRNSPSDNPETFDFKSPDEHLHRTELAALLTSAIDALPAPHRAVVMLRLVQGLSTRETAQCLRVTEPNVKTTLHRARALLADSLHQRILPDCRDQFAFAGHRCDRIVAGVLQRIT